MARMSKGCTTSHQTTHSDHGACACSSFHPELLTTCTRTAENLIGECWGVETIMYQKYPSNRGTAGCWELSDSSKDCLKKASPSKKLWNHEFSRKLFTSLKCKERDTRKLADQKGDCWHLWSSVPHTLLTLHVQLDSGLPTALLSRCYFQIGFLLPFYRWGKACQEVK